MSDTTFAAPAETVPRGRKLESAQARARLRTRYRAETRFRLYGMAAIGFSALFLVVLLLDIVAKSAPAFTRYQLVLPVPLTAEAIDPQNLRTPDSVAKGDFDRVVADALAELFPAITGRSDRRALESILSSGAADALRARVVANPALVGQTLKSPVTLSSDADLYYQGLSTNTIVTPGAGTATPSAATGTVTIFATADSFADQLQAVKQLIGEAAQKLRREAGRTAVLVKSADADLTAAMSRLAAAQGANDAAKVAVLQAEVDKIQKDKASLERVVADTRARADELQQRFDRVGAVEELDLKMPSLLVAINGGIVKAAKLGTDRLDGEVLVPLSSTADAPPGTWQRLVLERPED